VPRKGLNQAIFKHIFIDHDEIIDHDLDDPRGDFFTVQAIYHASTIRAPPGRLHDLAQASWVKHFQTKNMGAAHMGDPLTSFDPGSSSKPDRWGRCLQYASPGRLTVAWLRTSRGRGRVRAALEPPGFLTRRHRAPVANCVLHLRKRLPEQGLDAGADNIVWHLAHRDRRDPARPTCGYQPTGRRPRPTPKRRMAGPTKT
jgi:hypothetical protein